MAGDSSGKKWWKRLGVGGRKSAKSKKQDGSPQEGAIASSADSSQGNAVLSPEHAAPSTTTVPPALRSTADASTVFPPTIPPTPSNTALHTPLTNNGDKTPEIPQIAACGETADTKGELAGGSLWDRAYNALRNEEPERITVYEDILSKALARAQTETRPAPNGQATNHIPQDPVERREKLKKVTELGLEHMKQKKISTTLLGHEIVLQDVVANIAGVVEWAENFIKEAVKDLPYASIVMAGVSLVLPLLTNPPKDEAANQDGFTY
ncbi:hypothetical protein C8A03DRAFT_39724, partial [Achaetomium macrosporum]